ncbi:MULTISPECIES: 3-phosphoshikimate 1-carboxyvinyltransferase [Micrococcaceae]|uniref:3-phosphoshikimate 1-carboxyvinyltransferase n=1 Tax=unclassified Kocuria TaxID=2649579 RepID=UPI0018D837CC|nr:MULTISPECIES: 3-phosphoshikimate 1-carboxyvinyltransferase [unclassified Kocuria]
MNPSVARDWRAPVVFPDSSWSARVRVPGSKSLTNRYLFLAAIADGPSTLRGALESRDSNLMMEALERVGARFERDGQLVRVDPVSLDEHPSGGHARFPDTVEIDTGLAGTVMRFVPQLTAILGVPARFDGDAGARQRPMAPVIDALRQLGATVDDAGTGTLPFTILPRGAAAEGRERGEGTRVIHIDASTSSQFLSAAMLSGCLLPGGLTIRHEGSGIPSMPHVEMTIQTLAEYGVTVRTNHDSSWSVLPAIPRAHDVAVEPDLSNAGPFLAAAVVTGNTVTIPDWPATTTQGGDHWRRILPEFGAEVHRQGPDLKVTGPRGGALTGQLPGVDLDLSEAGELAPTVAAIAALAQQPSRLRGIGHLRGHETDRLKALVTEINRLGGRAEETEDGIRVLSPVRHGGLFETYEDHRMATAGAVIGLAVDGVVVENVDTTSKTLPDFTTLWEGMLEGGDI